MCSSAAVQGDHCDVCHSNVANGEGELDSLQLTMVTSSCFGLVKVRAFCDSSFWSVVWRASSLPWSRGREEMRR